MGRDKGINDIATTAPFIPVPLYIYLLHMEFAVTEENDAATIRTAKLIWKYFAYILILMLSFA